MIFYITETSKPIGGFLISLIPISFLGFLPKGIPSLVEKSRYSGKLKLRSVRAIHHGVNRVGSDMVKRGWLVGLNLWIGSTFVM